MPFIICRPESDHKCVATFISHMCKACGQTDKRGIGHRKCDLLLLGVAVAERLLKGTDQLYLPPWL